MLFFQIDDDLILRVLKPEHLDPFYALVQANRKHLRQWLPWVDKQKTREECKAFLDSLDEHLTKNKAMHCGIWHQNQICGVVGMDRIDWPNKTAEIGYWLGSQFEGMGMVTRCTRLLVEFAFVELKLNRIEIRCAPGNLRSRGIPERLGFREEGRLRQAEWLYDHYEDHIMYSLLAEEWEREHDPTLDIIPRE